VSRHAATSTISIHLPHYLHPLKATQLDKAEIYHD
jgi:hypothetical protein